MKTIDAYWEPIVRLNCNCLGGDDYIEIHREKLFHESKDKLAYYIKFIDTALWPFKVRLRTFRLFRSKWKSFIDGENQTYNGIYFNFKQLSEFYSILYGDALENEIITSEDIQKIESWKPIKEFEKYPWSDNENENLYTWILFKSIDNFVFSADIFDNTSIGDFKFSWAFFKDITKKQIRKYTREFLLSPKNYKFLCQENEIFLYKDDVVELFSVIYYILQNTQPDKKGYKITL